MFKYELLEAYLSKHKDLDSVPCAKKKKKKQTQTGYERGVEIWLIVKEETETTFQIIRASLLKFIQRIPVGKSFSKNNAYLFWMSINECILQIK